MVNHCARFTLALLLTLITTPLAHAGTWIVDDDGGPGVHFTTLQAAIDAAAPGDQILVFGGTYASCVMTEGLAVVALPGEVVTIAQGLGSALLTIQNLPVGQTATVSGLGIDGVLVQDCLGHVVLDELTVGPRVASSSLRVHDTALLTVSRTTIVGQTELLPVIFIAGERGMEVLRSTVIVSQCIIAGGRGGADDISAFGNGLPGYPGLDARNSTLIVQATDVSGGWGGSAFDDGGGILFGDGGDGAPAVQLDLAVLDLFGDESHLIRGGRAGTTEFGNAGSHASAVTSTNSAVTYGGVSFDVGPGAQTLAGGGFSPAAGPVPVLTADGGVMGASLDLTLDGPPFANYFLWASPAAAIVPVGATASAFLLDASLLLTVSTGTLDAFGAAAISVPLPVVPGLEGVAIHLQAGLQLQPLGKALSTSAAFVLR